MLNFVMKIRFEAEILSFGNEKFKFFTHEFSILIQNFSVGLFS